MIKTRTHSYLALIVGLVLLGMLPAQAQRQMEKLGRSVVAMAKPDGTVYVGWRMVGTDPEDVAFNLYRSANGGPAVQLTTNQTQTTDFVDTKANLAQTNSYFVRPVINGVVGAASGSFTIPANAPIHASYISIPYTFNPGDRSVDHGGEMVEVADFDGDGEYEYLVKWSHDGYCDPGQPFANTDSYKLDAYKLNGTRMWRIDLGMNVKTSPEYSPTVVCDLDGDGIAEIITKTAEGTTDGTGVIIGDTDGDGITDYRSGLYVPAGPEFLSVFSGATGKELARVPWIPRGGFGANGGNDENRGSRNNMTIAYLDGVTPSIIMCRGIYERMKMEAWNFRNGQLTNVWKWDSATDPLYQLWQTQQGVTAGKGSHMIRSGDVDGDGRDETLRGSMTMGPKGVPLFTKQQGHGDEMRFGDLDPDRPGLEVWMGYEDPPSPINGMQLYDAASGAVIFGIRTGISGPSDVGKSQSAPFDPAKRGFQGWGYDGMYDTKGNLLTTSQPGDGTRHEIWWDGKLTRNLVDEARVYTWNMTTHSSTQIYDGDAGGDPTKDYGYAGAADVLGDWREEILSPRLTELRIYTTTTPATNRLYTLMHDPIYRLSSMVQAQRKVPTSTPGFYLGPGMLWQPVAPFSDANLVWGGGGSNVWDTGATTNWHVNWYWSSNQAPAAFAPGQNVLFDLSGVSTNPVTLTGTLTPASVIVHAGNDYVFGGSGALAGSMKLTKAGRGTLTIATTNSYTGATLVTAGRLLVNGRLDQSPVTVRGGSPWGPTEVGGRGFLGNGLTAQAGGGISPGQGIGSPGTLRVSSGLTLAGGSLNNFDLSDDPTGTIKTNDLIAVTGNVTLAGTNTLIIKELDGALSPGLYPLVTYTGTLAGGMSNLLVSGVPEVSYVLTNPPGQIALLVRSTRAVANGLTWLGGQGNVWDLATRTNWLNGGVQDWFIAGDRVRFDATGAANPSVTLNSTMIIGSMVVDATSDYSINGTGNIGGSGGVTKTNSGKLSLLTDNTYTGSTSVDGGTLEVDWVAEAGKPSPLGLGSTNSTNLVLRGGSTLRVTGLASLYTDRGMTLTNGVCAVAMVTSSTDLSMYGLITGNGTLLKTGAGSLDINGNNTYTGGTIISQGKLVVLKQSALGDPVGALIFTNGGTLDGLAGTFTRPIILQAGGGVIACTATIPTLISGPGSLTYSGGDLLTISGANNTYSGGTYINNGYIWITAPGALGTGNITIVDGGALVMRPGVTLVTNKMTIAGTGALGAPAAIYLHGSDGTFSGTVTLSADALIATANTAGLDINLNGPVFVGGHVLTLKPNNADPSNVFKWGINGVLSGTGDLIWDSACPGSTLTLTAANSFSGDMVISDAAALVLSNSLALQNSLLVYTNGNVLFGKNLTAFMVGGLTGNANLALTNLSGSPVTLAVGNNNSNTLYSGSMSRSGGLVKIGSGTLTLTGTNLCTGPTVVSNGTLEVTSLLTNASTLTVQGGATLQLTSGTLSPATVSVLTNGLLTGCGTINATLFNSGTVMITCGTLILNGAVTNYGVISVPLGMTIIFNGPVMNNGIVDASGGGTVIINSTWTGDPYISVAPGGSYTNTMTGNWSAVAWQPSLPISGIQTTNVFANSAAINSTNDLGGFDLNQLRFAGQAVNLAGQSLVFGGTAPLVTNQQNYACSIANPVTLSQDTTFGISLNTMTVSGPIDGSFGLSKTGPGKLALTGSNTYGGGTTIGGGTLSITSDSQLGAAGSSLTFTNGGVLQVSSGLTLNNRAVVLQTGGGILTNTSAVTLNKAISGTGRLTKSGSGQLNLSVGNTHSGGTWINAGTTKITAANASSVFGSGPVSIASGAQVWDNVSGANDRTWNNNFTIGGDGGSGAGGGANSGSIFLNSGAYITINGTVALSANAKLATANTSDIGFVLNGDVSLGAYTLTLKGGSGATQAGWAINGAISGTGGLSWTSSSTSSQLTLSGSNSFSGGTVLSGASLAIANVNALKNSTLDTGSSGGQTVTFTVAGNNTYNLGGLQGAVGLAISLNNLNIGANGASSTYSGPISGGGGIIKSGAGTLTLSGTNTYTGGTIVSNGTLRLTHSLCLSPSTMVWLWSGATSDLAFSGTNTVYALYIDGQPKLAGVYGSAALPGKLSGTGYLRTLWPTNGYEAWAAQIVNGQTGYNQSATGDGYPNLLKYATGSSPAQSDTLARMNGILTNGQFAFVFHRNTSATDISLFVEGANSIGSGMTWSGIATNLAGSWGGAANVTETGAGSPVTVTVRDSAGATTNRFFRLRVTRP